MHSASTLVALQNLVLCCWQARTLPLRSCSQTSSVMLSSASTLVALLDLMVCCWQARTLPLRPCFQTSSAMFNNEVSALRCESPLLVRQASRTFKNWRAAPLQAPEAGGGLPLVVQCTGCFMIAGGCPLPFFGRQGRRAQPLADLMGLPNPVVQGWLEGWKWV